jgi:hypothetical protein
MPLWPHRFVVGFAVLYCLGWLAVFVLEALTRRHAVHNASLRDASPHGVGGGGVGG